MNASKNFSEVGRNYHIIGKELHLIFKRNQPPKGCLQPSIFQQMGLHESGELRASEKIHCEMKKNEYFHVEIGPLRSTANASHI